MKDFTIDFFFPCLINPFVINGVYKFKRKRKHYVKKQAKCFSYFVLQNLKYTADRLE